VGRGRGGCAGGPMVREPVTIQGINNGKRVFLYIISYAG
jgi:hypothetical protein